MSPQPWKSEKCDICGTWGPVIVSWVGAIRRLCEDCHAGYVVPMDGGRG